MNNKDDKRSSDSIDRLIFEQKLCIKTLHIDKDLDLLLLIFNNGNVLKAKLSDYPRLKKANNSQLSDYKLINGGVGIQWEALEEDLSLKGFIKTSALNQMMRN
ncbi:DUF2442 domain-containing protein [Brumimicrobium oceani]|uniref:DUF2442 domain-containing protein n=1 Tax=Brumimicrobium oceani TaxID=2100725 RepID=UPI001304BA37|nr:DUF2442 domain-containing protein [Brumimicrobium oceani]